MDAVNLKYGKHKVYLGTSHLANRFGAHVGDRGDAPERKEALFKGETARKRIGIPMFMGVVR